MSTPRWVRYDRDALVPQDDWTNFTPEKTLTSLTRLPGAVEPGLNTDVLENYTNIAEDMILSVHQELVAVDYDDATPALKHIVRGLILLLLAEMQGNKADVQAYMDDIVTPFIFVNSAGTTLSDEATPVAGQGTLVAMEGYEMVEEDEEEDWE